jgi:hypothetical protein
MSGKARKAAFGRNGEHLSRTDNPKTLSSPMTILFSAPRPLGSAMTAPLIAHSILACAGGKEHPVRIFQRGIEQAQAFTSTTDYNCLEGNQRLFPGLRRGQAITFRSPVERRTGRPEFCAVRGRVVPIGRREAGCHACYGVTQTFRSETCGNHCFPLYTQLLPGPRRS